MDLALLGCCHLISTSDFSRSSGFPSKDKNQYIFFRKWWSLLIVESIKFNGRKPFVGQSKSKGWQKLAHRPLIFNFHLNGPFSWRENPSPFNTEVWKESWVLTFWSLQCSEIHTKSQALPNPHSFFGGETPKLYRIPLIFIVGHCDFLLYLKTSNLTSFPRNPNIYKKKWRNMIEKIN